MLGLDSFWKKEKPDGFIKYYGIESWWLKEFTKDERKRIRDVYRPGPYAIDQGHYLNAGMSEFKFIASMIGWFSHPSDKTICNKIINRAESLIDNNVYVLDLHFYYQSKLQYYYRHRNTDPLALELAIQACKDQIKLSEKAAAALLKEFPSSPLPAHSGFKQLSIIYDKQSRYLDAIALCLKAESQGWAGDWENRISRYQKKSNK